MPVYWERVELLLQASIRCNIGYGNMNGRKISKAILLLPPTGMAKSQSMISNWRELSLDGLCWNMCATILSSNILACFVTTRQLSHGHSNSQHQNPLLQADRSACWQSGNGQDKHRHYYQCILQEKTTKWLTFRRVHSKTGNFPCT